MDAAGVTDPLATAERFTSRMRLAVAVHLFLAIAYFVPGASWSPASRFALTRAIVEHGTFEITPYADSTGDRAQVGHRYFTDKAPVPSVLAVPAYSIFYAIAKWRHRTPRFVSESTPEEPAKRVSVSPAYSKGLYVSSLSTSGLSGVLLGCALFEVLRRRTTERTAALGALATVIGTPLFPYATSFFGHTIAGAFLFTAFALVDPLGPLPTRRRLVVSGVLLALAGGSEYIVFLPAGLVALHALWVAPRARRLELLALISAGAAPVLALLGVYHAVCFGSPFRTGYSFITNPAFASGQARGFLGITYPRLEAFIGVLFSPSRGLLYLSPLCAVALVGAWFYRRERDPALALGLLVFALLLLVNSSYFQWDGGIATGPRHLVPALGFLGIAIAFAFEHANLKTIAAAAAGLSCTIMLLITAVGLEAPTRVDVIFDYMIPDLQAGIVARIAGASNWGIALGLGKRASTVPVLVWTLAGALFVGWLSSRGLPEGPAGDEP